MMQPPTYGNMGMGGGQMMGDQNATQQPTTQENQAPQNTPAASEVSYCP